MKKSIVLLLTAAIICSNVLGVTAFAAPKHEKGKRQEKEEVLQGLNKDEYSEIDPQLSKEINDFWAAQTEKEVEMYDFNSDGEVTLKKEHETMSNQKQLKEFRKDFTNLVNRVHESNLQKGIHKDKVDISKGGKLLFGASSSGCSCHEGTTCRGSINLNDMKRGDVLLQNCPGTAIYGEFEHVGFYAGPKFGRARSAQPDEGVCLEYPRHWGLHKSLYLTRVVKNNGAWVGATVADNAFDKACQEAQLGEPYNILSSKTNVNSWYCSKIPWYGYKNSKNALKIDIDATNDSHVTPDNIYYDDNIVLKKVYS